MKVSVLIRRNPSPDGSGNPFAPWFGVKDCIGQQVSAPENKY
jgi:hypothetical protein